MYAKFFKAAERRKKAQALMEENETLCQPPTEEQSDETDSTQLKKNVSSVSYNNSCESGIDTVCSDYSNSIQTDTTNLPKTLESLHLSKPSMGNIKTRSMLLKERKLAQSRKGPSETLINTVNDGEHIMESSSVSSNINIETERKIENGMKPRRNITNICMSNLVKMYSGDLELVDSTFVDTTVNNDTHDSTKEINKSLNGSKPKVEGKKMTRMNKVHLGTDEKERDRKHMFPAEGSKSVPDRPAELMENGIQGTKQKMGAAKMIQMDFMNGNQAESSNILTDDIIDDGHIFPTKPSYVSSKNTSGDCLLVSKTLNSLDCRRGDTSKLDLSPVVRPYKNKQSHRNANDMERRTAFNKLVQKRNPEVRQITNTLELPSLFDKLVQSVNDMNYNEGQNPVAVLNELIPDLEYRIEKTGPQHLPIFKVSVNIHGRDYCGVGNTKKDAKIKTAMVALKEIGSSGRTSTGTGTSIPKNRESTHISNNQRGGSSTSTEIISSGQTRNPVSALNDLRKGLRYHCIAQYGPSHIPKFRVSVKVDQTVHYGTGGSKNLAKANAAMKALMCINGKTNNLQGASVASKPIQSTTNVATTSASKPNTTGAVPKGKPPFAVLNDLYPNQEVSWTVKDSDGNVSFTITVEGKKFKGIGLNLKSAKNNAAAKALHELRGFSPTNWENH